MTATRDPDRLIQSFLDEGLTELPDRSYDAVRGAIERTGQRAGIGPWRSRPMPSVSRFAAITAACTVVALIGAAVVAWPVFGPGGIPRPTPTGVTAPTSAPSTVYRPYDWPATLQPGTYATPFAWKNPFEIAFTVGAGWQSRDIEIVKDTGASVSVQLVENIYPDPCTAVLGPEPIGPGVDDLVQAIASISLINAGPPTRVSRSGFDGRAFEYTPPASLCGGPEGRLWAHPELLIAPSDHHGPPTWPLRSGTHRVEIYDVNGRRLLIDATAGPDATPAEIKEVDGVLASLRILASPLASTIGDCEIELSAPATGPLPIAPYRVALGMREFELNGIHPESPSTGLPSAQVDFLVTGLSFGNQSPATARPTVGVIPPIDSTAVGFATLMSGGADSYVGSAVLDAAGVWWVEVTLPSAGCFQRFPVEVLPLPQA